MKAKILNEATDLLAEYGNTIVVEDEELTVNGTQIDVIRLVEAWDGGQRIEFYAGHPELDGTDEEGEWEQLELSDKEQEHILKEVINMY